MIPLDPFAALDALQSAIQLVKKASQTADDLSSLGPILGKYFNAKAGSEQVLEVAKSGGFKGSAMGKATELEMALDQAAVFEEKVKMLFFQSGKADVWQKIKARAAKMDAEAAEQARSERIAASKKKRETEEMIELIASVIAGLILFVVVFGGGLYFYLNCNKYGCY